MISRLADLSQRHGILDIYVFGSRAEEIPAHVRGDRTRLENGPSDLNEHSDVDVGVRPPRGKHMTSSERVDLALELEHLFEVGRVDLVVVPAARAYLARNIIAGELLYTSDPDGQAEFELYVLRRAGDLARFERQRRAIILGFES